MDLSDLKADPKNPRTISKDDFNKLKELLKEYGDLSGIIKNETTGELVGGHMRVNAFKEMGSSATIQITQSFDEPTRTGTTAIGYVIMDGEMFTYRVVQWPKEKQSAANIAANRAGGDFDHDLLAQVVYELSELENGAELLAMTGLLEDEVNKLIGEVSGDEPEPKGNLADEFIAPPFSILDTRQGYWQDRKRAWLNIGIKSEEGRGNALTYASESSTDEVSKKMLAISGTSVFDPVLCELIYRWFNVPNGSVLDTFAGGSVRGVIASKLGHQYVGVELSAKQVEANRVQGNELCGDPMPVWIEGDSTNVGELTQNAPADLFFSCPPYADLEVYSQDPADLSNMAYPDFLTIYTDIIKKGCLQLKDNRFAVFVIGEVRGKNGAYYNFVGDTINAFKEAGLSYYNEMILLNALASLPMRAANQFNGSRKIGKAHQNVLVFYKGDLKAIKGNYPELDFSELENMFAEETTEKELQ